MASKVGLLGMDGEDNNPKNIDPGQMEGSFFSDVILSYYTVNFKAFYKDSATLFN